MEWTGVGVEPLVDCYAGPEVTEKCGQMSVKMTESNSTDIPLNVQITLVTIFALFFVQIYIVPV